MASRRVSAVKKTIMAVVITATGFLHTPQIMADPRIASRKARATAPAFASGRRKVMWRKRR